MDKFIVNFNDHSTVRALNRDTVTLGDSMSVSAHNSVSQHPFTEKIEYNPYATFFTLALPTNGWSNRTNKFNPSLEEQSEYFATNFNNLVISNKQPFTFMYSLEYNEDMANIHAHGVIHQYTNADFNRFKKELRKIFKLAPANRIAIKYYKTDSQFIEGKYKYHLTDKDYEDKNKNKVHNYYTTVRR